MSGAVEATAKLAPCPHCGESHAEDQLRCPKTDMLLPLEGRRLDGRFRFLSSLGSGGMAAVWLARNERVDREVAIKFLRPEVGRDPEAVARFRSEARAAGRIGNEHICEILDLGDSPIGPYMVMERLRGLDLAALIRRQGRLQPAYAVRIVRHALEGLAAAHAAGIIHRDLKPGNVFLHRTDAGETQVKLMDFGVSKFLDGTGEAMTASGILLGTPEYMAPEQLEGANKLGPAADIFAVGAILYRAITGELVFSGANLAAVLRSMAVDDPTPVDRLVEGLPPELVAIIHRCLARDPDARFPSAQALSDALAPFEEFEGEVRALDPPSRATSGSMSAAKPPAVEPRPERSESESADIEIEPDSEHGHDASESVESATKLWKDSGSSGPLRGRNPDGHPTSKHEKPTPSSSVDEPRKDEPRKDEPRKDEPRKDEPPKRRSLGPLLLLLVLVLAAAGYYQREWVVEQLAVASSTIQDLANADPPAAEADDVEASPGSDSTAATGATDEATDESAGETSETGTETGTAEPESETSETGDTDPDETEGSDETVGGELVTDRPAPAGTFRANSYITPNDPGPVGDQAAARKYCEGLATVRFAGVSKWRLANPAELGNFVGSKVKKARYWTSAIWQGKARVYALPGGKKASEKLDKKIARPLCVARW
jgi:serine/threonine protein kinase